MVKIQDKRLFVCDGKLIDCEPVGFEVNREAFNSNHLSRSSQPSEKVQILYQESTDVFFQLQ
jgi:hypothetical protein